MKYFKILFVCKCCIVVFDILIFSIVFTFSNLSKKFLSAGKIFLIIEQSFPLKLTFERFKIFNYWGLYSRWYSDFRLRCTRKLKMAIKFIILIIILTLFLSVTIILSRDGHGPGGPRAGAGRAGPGLKIQARGPYGPKRPKIFYLIVLYKAKNSNFC